MLIHRSGVGAAAFPASAGDTDAAGPPATLGGIRVQAHQTPSLVAEEKVLVSVSETPLFVFRDLTEEPRHISVPWWGRMIKAISNFFP